MYINVESLRSSPETNILLYVNYISSKKKIKCVFFRDKCENVKSKFHNIVHLIKITRHGKKKKYITKNEEKINHQNWPGNDTVDRMSN